MCTNRKRGRDCAILCLLASDEALKYPRSHSVMIAFEGTQLTYSVLISAASASLIWKTLGGLPPAGIGRPGSRATSNYFRESEDVEERLRCQQT